MLKVLKFVKGAVARKDFIPALTHFYIDNGIIQSFNGKLSLSSPIDLDITATPKAAPFIKAIEACKDQVTMYLTGSGRLAIKSGTFKAFIECTGDTYPEVVPSGGWYPLEDFNLISVLKKLTPFIAQDASRPWARGVLFRGESCFATNNIALIEHALPKPFPIEVNVPEDAIKELIRIGEDPIGLQVDDKSITFFYTQHKWVRSNLLDIAWPDLSKVLDHDGVTYSAIPNTFFEALESIGHFTDDMDRAYLKDGYVTTSEDAEIGAQVEVPGLEEVGAYNRSQLLNLEGVSNTWALVKEPRKLVLFMAENLRGTIIGMHS